MAALIPIVAGAYTAVYDSNDIGETKDGFDLEMGYEGEDVIADLYGDSVIDTVYRGGNVHLISVGLDWASINSVRFLFGDADIGASGLIGRMAVGSSIAVALVLTAVTGTTAAASSPATLTAAHAITAMGYTDAIKFANRARETPCRWRLYLSTVTATDRWFSIA